MKKQKKSAADQLDEEAKRRALNRLASRQAISESQAQPEFHANHERLKAERLGRESQPNGMGMSNLGMQQPAPELPELFQRHSSSRSRRTASLRGFLDFSHVFDGPLR